MPNPTSDDAPSPDGYTFSRSNHDTVRLLAQHYVWQSQLNYHLRPSIPSPTPSNPYHVADVCAGTLAWSLDLLHQHQPSIQITALDISPEQAPPLSTLPDNVKWEKWDIFTPPPTHLQGKFDVVHARLLICLIRDIPTAETVIKHFSMLLKLGGYLQWEEIDVSTTDIVLPGHEGSREECPNLLGILDWYRPQPFHEWIQHMDEIMTGRYHGSSSSTSADSDGELNQRGAAFAEAKNFNVPPRPEYFKMQTAVNLMSWRGILGEVKARDEKRGTEMLRMLDNAEHEIAQRRAEDVGFAFGIRVVVGRKGDS